MNFGVEVIVDVRALQRMSLYLPRSVDNKNPPNDGSPVLFCIEPIMSAKRHY